MARKANWCFTLNNPTELEVQQIHEYAGSDFKYLVYGEETGQEGTPHLQGYLELKNTMTLSAIKKRFRYLERAHFEERKGTRNQAIIYCTKDGAWFEFGQEGWC